MLKFAIPAAVALALAAGAAQAATCPCVAQQHHRRHIPAHDYVPSHRSHPVRRLAYAEVAYGPGFYEPAYGPVYEPVAYPPPPPPWAYGPPGYEAADVAYVGPEPGWRPVGHRVHRICRPRHHEDKD